MPNKEFNHRMKMINEQNRKLYDFDAERYKIQNNKAEGYYDDDDDEYRISRSDDDNNDKETEDEMGTTTEEEERKKIETERRKRLVKHRNQPKQNNQDSSFGERVFKFFDDVFFGDEYEVEHNQPTYEYRNNTSAACSVM